MIQFTNNAIAIIFGAQSAQQQLQCKESKEWPAMHLYSLPCTSISLFSSVFLAMHSIHCIPLRLHTDTSCKAYQTNWMKCITKQLSTFHGVHYNAIVLHPVCGLECSGDHWRLKYTEVQMAFTRSPSLSNNPKILNNYLIFTVFVCMYLYLYLFFSMVFLGAQCATGH